MKYVVMECHPAYSILMDETSSFVYAANLHYEVGQIVENPMLMEENQKIQKSGISISVRKVIAAAACVLLMIGSGVGYYQGNLAVYSTIVVSAAADVSMQVNSHGKVLSLESINLYGEQLLENYDGKGKDKLLVTNELIQKAIAMGYLVSGDTVYFYIDTPKSALYSSYKSELEQEMTAYADLNAAVEQYRTNEPLPEKVQPETETTQETEVSSAASETILETTAPEISIPEQEVIIQEEIIPQEEAIQEEIPTPENAPLETSVPVQETELEIPGNIPVQNEPTVPVPEEPSEQQPSEWNYENWKNWENWYGYDEEYPEKYFKDWYDNDDDEYDPSEYSEKNSWNWDMWGSWDDNNTPDTAETQEEPENWNNYNWHYWKNHPDYYDYYSYGREECPADPYEPEEEEDIDEFAEYRYFDYEELP